MKSLRKIINITCCFLLLCSCKGKSISISPIGADSIPNIARERTDYIDTLRSAISHNIKDADFEIFIKQGDKVVYCFGGYNYPKDDALMPNGERVDSCLMKDINFDGVKDVLVYLGDFGNSGIEYFDAFVWSAETKQYIYAAEFKNIPNPYISEKDKCILSAARCSAAEDNYAQYVYEKGLFMKIAELRQYWKGNIYPEKDKAIYEEHFIKTNVWKKKLKLNQISKFWRPVI